MGNLKELVWGIEIYGTVYQGRTKPTWRGMPCYTPYTFNGLLGVFDFLSDSADENSTPAYGYWVYLNLNGYEYDFFFLDRIWVIPKKKKVNISLQPETSSNPQLEPHKKSWSLKILYSVSSYIYILKSLPYLTIFISFGISENVWIWGPSSQVRISVLRLDNSLILVN